MIPATGARVCGSLQERAVVRARLALVVAHPDDETVGAGGSLHLMPELLIVQVTDGAPRGLDDMARAGFATPRAYAAAREAEVQDALRVAGVAPDRVHLDIPDQDAAMHVADVAAALRALFSRHGTEAVITHAYEGGHPDHDAVAFAVHAAAGDRAVVEYPSYRAGPDGMVVQRFLPGPPETLVRLRAAELRRKRVMLACFRTQASIMAWFSSEEERFRPAPRQDWTRPPHRGPLNYETWGWNMTGARWREQVACAC